MASKPNKTHATEVSVPDYLATVQPDVRRQDAVILCDLMTRVTGQPARMWGPGMVGFGVRHYRYESGREGDIFKVGFAPRKPAMVLYGMGSVASAEMISRLGKVTMGKGCIYIKSLADIDGSTLEELIVKAFANTAD